MGVWFTQSETNITFSNNVSFNYKRLSPEQQRKEESKNSLGYKKSLKKFLSQKTCLHIGEETDSKDVQVTQVLELVVRVLGQFQKTRKYLIWN